MHRQVRLSGIAFLACLRRLPPVLGAIVAMTSAAAAGGPDWDGTWHGGFDNGGDGVQVVMIGPQVMGFYFHGDYLDTDTGTAAADGAITFHWDGGQGTLAGDSNKRRLTIHETGKPDRVIPLDRDD